MEPIGGIASIGAGDMEINTGLELTMLKKVMETQEMVGAEVLQMLDAVPKAPVVPKGEFIDIFI